MQALLKAGTRPDWRTADFAPGDAVVLRLDCLHMSAQNTTDLLRVSADTRWKMAGQDNPAVQLTDWRLQGNLPP